jgi:hypothetical protein
VGSAQMSNASAWSSPVTSASGAIAVVPVACDARVLGDHGLGAAVRGLVPATARRERVLVGLHTEKASDRREAAVKSGRRPGTRAY